MNVVFFIIIMCLQRTQDAQQVNKETKAVVTDPDGYKVTLVEGESADVLTALTLRVFDMEKATAFYNKLGKTILLPVSYPHWLVDRISI